MKYILAFISNKKFKISKLIIFHSNQVRDIKYLLIQLFHIIISIKENMSNQHNPSPACKNHTIPDQDAMLDEMSNCFISGLPIMQNRHKEDSAVQIHHPEKITDYMKSRISPKNDLYVGSVLIYGWTKQKNFHTNGDEVQLDLKDQTSAFQLQFNCRDHKYRDHEIKSYVILASSLKSLIRSPIAKIRFIIQVYESYEKNFNTKIDEEKKIVPIRLDIFMGRVFFRANPAEMEQQKNSQNQISQNRRRDQLMLIYLLKKCRINVEVPSLVKPSPQTNMLFKHFLLLTTGIVKKLTKLGFYSQDKSRRWRKQFGKCGTYHPCVIAQKQNKMNLQQIKDITQWQQITKKTDDHFYKQRVIAKSQGKVIWVLKVFIHKQVIQNQKQKCPPPQYRFLKGVELQIVQKNADNNFRQIGADYLAREIYNKKTNEEDFIIEQSNKQKNIKLLRKFQEQIKYFTQHQTPSSMQYSLKNYQAQALQWMKYREGKIPYHQLFEEHYSQFSEQDFQRKLSIFWQKIRIPSGEEFYINQMTGDISNKSIQGKRVKGGILADDIGLGKTVMLLSLLADEKFEGTNLIVVPVAVLGQWENQIKKHIRGKINVLNFNSEPTQKRRKIDLKQYSVVLVTYQTLGAEYKAYKDSNKPMKNDEQFIFEFDFRRVVLDEAHTIREPETNQCRAVMALEREFSWCLTGTLIQNSEKDLFPILAFLDVEFFGEWKWFKQYVLKSASFQAKLYNLYTIMRPIVLRRTKLTSEIKLPDKTEHCFVVPFSQQEQRLYKQLEQGAIEEIELNLQGGGNYVYALSIINKLRQFCCHPRLVLGDRKFTDLEDKSVKELAKLFFSKNLTNQFKENVTNSVFEDVLGQCIICLSEIEPDDLVIAKCGHFFHEECAQTLGEYRNRCPSCRFQFEDKSFLKKNQLKEQGEQIIQKNKNLAEVAQHSTKLKEILKTIGRIHQKKQKCIVFTQYLKMIDILQQSLEKQGIMYRNIKGSMKGSKREEQIQQFKTLDDCHFLIVSIRAGSMGLNLQTANNVIICDPWWNPAQEDQAIGRSHRMGQEKPVEVYRFYMKQSIEEKIKVMHKKKQILGNQIMMAKTQRQTSNPQQGIKELIKLLKD